MDPIPAEKRQIARWLLGMLRDRCPAPRLLLGCEVGVKQAMLASLLLESDPAISLYLVDRWAPAPPESGYARIGDPAANASAEQHRAWEREAMERLTPYSERVTILKGESDAMAVGFSQDRVDLDFVFIDADHSYDGRLADLCNWYPHVRVGGLVAGGLLVSGFGGDCGRRALNDFLEHSQLCPDLLLGPANTWAFRKPQMPVRAAVLCPGPSLTRTWRGRCGYDIVIGVNRAVSVEACDYWAMLDAVPFYHTQPLGTPTVLCQTPEWAKVLKYIRDGNGVIPRHISPEDVDRSIRRELWGVAARYRFSMLAGITLAHSFGAAEVDVYGCDWSGIADFDGKELTQNCRDEQRWRNERDSYESLVLSLANFGTRVRRMEAA